MWQRAPSGRARERRRIRNRSAVFVYSADALFALLIHFAFVYLSSECPIVPRAGAEAAAARVIHVLRVAILVVASHFWRCFDY